MSLVHTCGKASLLSYPPNTTSRFPGASKIIVCWARREIVRGAMHVHAPLAPSSRDRAGGTFAGWGASGRGSSRLARTDSEVSGESTAAPGAAGPANQSSNEPTANREGRITHLSWRYAGEPRPRPAWTAARRELGARPATQVYE